METQPVFGVLMHAVGALSLIRTRQYKKSWSRKSHRMVRASFVRLVPVLLFILCAAGFAVEKKQGPLLVPQPEMLQGVAEPVVCLGGTWQFYRGPSGSVWDNVEKQSLWDPIRVPGECVMQGFDIEQNVEYYLKTAFTVPDDFAGYQVLLRFDRVYSYARIWVNGIYVRDHHGGFTTWDCDITSNVTAGEKAVLCVGVTDAAPEVSWGSGYAKHNIGGILGDVQLFAVPGTHIDRLEVETRFRGSFEKADLLLTAGMRFAGSKKVNLRLDLRPSGDPKPVASRRLKITPQRPLRTVVLPVDPVKAWDAEHPELYHLTVTVLENGMPLQKVTRRVGFREVKRRGRELLVNGRPVKLLGVNRHNVHPLSGRAITAEYDSLDVRLFKQANVNFIRTSHYPPTRAFLDACDRYGMYVEEESAVCFVNTWGNPIGPGGPSFLPRYLDQFAEMLRRDRHHPCVIMWSLGNESRWNDAFAATFKYVSARDSTRPVIFSYPETVPAGTEGFDIYSYHYPEYSDNLNSFNPCYPILLDEMAHVPCYNRKELICDPNVRNFWGQSIKRFSADVFSVKGLLGACIWCGIDEVFQVPLEEHQKPVNSRDFDPYGYGEWGIIDGWRRQKPEFWHVKKAYSPVRVPQRPIAVTASQKYIRLPVENRYFFSDLHELEVRWQLDDKKGMITELSVPPQSCGELKIPAGQCGHGDTLTLGFYRNDRLVDLYKLPVFMTERFPVPDMQHPDYYRDLKHFSRPSGPVPEVTQRGDVLVVSGQNFKVRFSTKTGMIVEGRYGDAVVLTGGPGLHLVPASLGAWEMFHFNVYENENSVTIKVTGAHGDVRTAYDISVFGNGVIQTDCRIENPPIPPNRTTQNSGAGFKEAGLAFLLSPAVNRLSWDRKSLWSAYPENHIGRPCGTAVRRREAGREIYRQEPGWPWSLDMKNFYLCGRSHAGFGATRDFRAMRENIWYASAVLENSTVRLRAESRASHAVRMQPQADGAVKMIINQKWNYPDLRWGNYIKDAVWITPGETISARVRMADRDTYAAAVTIHIRGKQH